MVAKRSDESKVEGEKPATSNPAMCGKAVVLPFGEGGPIEAELDADDALL